MAEVGDKKTPKIHRTAVGLDPSGHDRDEQAFIPGPGGKVGLCSPEFTAGLLKNGKKVYTGREKSGEAGNPVIWVDEDVYHSPAKGEGNPTPAQTARAKRLAGLGDEYGACVDLPENRSTAVAWPKDATTPFPGAVYFVKSPGKDKPFKGLYPCNTSQKQGPHFFPTISASLSPEHMRGLAVLGSYTKINSCFEKPDKIKGGDDEDDEESSSQSKAPAKAFLHLLNEPGRIRELIAQLTGVPSDKIYDLYVSRDTDFSATANPLIPLPVIKQILPQLFIMLDESLRSEKLHRESTARQEGFQDRMNDKAMARQEAFQRRILWQQLGLNAFQMGALAVWQQRRMEKFQRELQGGKDIDPMKFLQDHTKDAARPDYVQVIEGPTFNKALTEMIEVSDNESRPHIFVTSPPDVPESDSGGIGKSKVIQRFLQMVAQKDPRVPHLHGKTIIVFDTGAFAAEGAQIVGLLDKAFKALDGIVEKNPNIIIYVPESHQLDEVGVASLGNGKVSESATDKLKTRLLAEGAHKIYKKAMLIFDSDKSAGMLSRGSVGRRFNKVVRYLSTIDEAVDILRQLTDTILGRKREGRPWVFEPEVYRAIVEISPYVQDGGIPSRDVNALEEFGNYLRRKNVEGRIGLDTVVQYASEKMNVSPEVVQELFTKIEALKQAGVNEADIATWTRTQRVAAAQTARLTPQQIDALFAQAGRDGPPPPSGHNGGNGPGGNGRGGVGGNGSGEPMPPPGAAGTGGAPGRPSGGPSAPSELTRTVPEPEGFGAELEIKGDLRRLEGPGIPKKVGFIQGTKGVAGGVAPIAIPKVMERLGIWSPEQASFYSVGLLGAAVIANPAALPEFVVTLAPFMLGEEGAKYIADKGGQALHVESLRQGQLGNDFVGIAGGLATVAGFVRAVGPETIRAVYAVMNQALIHGLNAAESGFANNPSVAPVLTLLSAWGIVLKAGVLEQVTAAGRVVAPILTRIASAWRAISPAASAGRGFFTIDALLAGAGLTTGLVVAGIAGASANIAAAGLLLGEDTKTTGRKWRRGHQDLIHAEEEALYRQGRGPIMKRLERVDVEEPSDEEIEIRAEGVDSSQLLVQK